MTSDRLADAVREQVALGRILPLGKPADGVWITEQAVAGVLRTAAAVRGVRLGLLRVSSDLRVDAAFEVMADRPLPVVSQRLRQAMWDAAHDRLGLGMTGVDLTITGLLDTAPPVPEPLTPAPPPPGGTGPAAVPAVPGVARLTSRLGGAGSDAYLQIAVAPGHRAIDVARAVREVAAPLAVLVTDVD